jgi:hypothetical protein
MVLYQQNEYVTTVIGTGGKARVIVNIGTGKTIVKTMITTTAITERIITLPTTTVDLVTDKSVTTTTVILTDEENIITTLLTNTVDQIKNKSVTTTTAVQEKAIVDLITSTSVTMIHFRSRGERNYDSFSKYPNGK